MKRLIEMPTVLRVEGFQFYFFDADRNEPPHIHVERGDGAAKFWLDPVELVHYRKFKKQEIRRAGEIVEEYQDFLMDKWHEYFSE